MLIKHQGYVLPASKALTEILQNILSTPDSDAKEGVVLNFKDPNYSPESGGYHPIEISISKEGKLLYITDFSFVGQVPYCELAKEIDFDFQSGIFLASP